MQYCVAPIEMYRRTCIDGRVVASRVGDNQGAPSMTSICPNRAYKPELSNGKIKSLRKVKNELKYGVLKNMQWCNQEWQCRCVLVHTYKATFRSMSTQSGTFGVNALKGYFHLCNHLYCSEASEIKNEAPLHIVLINNLLGMIGHLKGNQNLLLYILHM